MRSLLAPLALATLVAAAPAPDPLLQQVIAGARAASPAATAFERTVKVSTQEAGGPVETRTRVDRWDGQQLTPVSINGKPPTDAEIADFRKTSAGRPVPGYHRIADYLQAGAVRAADPQGRVVYRVNGLPKGTVNVGKDISANLVAEAIVETSGAQPYVSKLRVVLPKPLSFFMVAKLDSFELVNEYRPGPGGRPAIIKGMQTMTGAQFGKAGTTRTETSYNSLR